MPNSHNAICHSHTPNVCANICVNFRLSVVLRFFDLTFTQAQAQTQEHRLDLSMEPMVMKDGWRFSMEDNGVLYVMTTLTM